MNPVEANQLLIWLAGADARHKPTDNEQAVVKTRVWADLLQDVPGPFALDVARRHYGKAQQKDQMLNPGTIRSAWVAHRDREVIRQDRLDEQAAIRRSVQPTIIPSSGIFKKRPAWFDDAVKACDKARTEGASSDDLLAISQAFIPGGVRPPAVGTPETYDKACALGSKCLCSHTECTRGWLDEEVDVQSPKTGVTYKATKRCDVCAESMEMKDEVATARKTRR